MRSVQLLSVLLLAACSRNSTPIDSAESAPAAAPAASSTTTSAATTGSAPMGAANALPPGHPPIAAQPGSEAHGELPPGHPPVATQPAAAQQGSNTALGNEAHAGGLTWTSSAPLQRRTPKTSMRAAEYGVAGDNQAELSVFYFGPGQGGSVDANITRWLGQIKQPDGEAKREETKVNGVSVATVEAHGTYSGGMAMPGAPSSGPISNAIMLGAIATGPQGPVFFKLVGPGEAVERARSAFEKLIASLHPG